MDSVRILSMLKKCIWCHEEKPLDCFSKDKNKKFGVKSYCKPCNVKRTAGWRESNPGRRQQYEKDRREADPEAQRGRNLKHKYGIGLKEWQEMFDLQGGHCASCGKHQADLEKTLVVDHCHSTGRVRALLCNHCNIILGYAKESIDTLESVANYIKEYC